MHFNISLILRLDFKLLGLTERRMAISVEAIYVVIEGHFGIRLFKSVWIFFLIFVVKFKVSNRIRCAQ